MQRAAAVVGLTLMTGGILGFTATAASAAPAGQAEKTTQSVEDGRRGDDDDRGGDDNDRRGDHDRRGWGNDWDRSYVAGWFPSRRMCLAVGWAGERRGKWEDPHCYQVGRRAWVLKVQPDHGRHRRH
jgi:hypothetical protein